MTGWLHKGETVPNLVAGLAYSIALNYLNRVVRGRQIGDVIYFQGGTAYNDAVAAAFAGLLGKKITVPPYNGVMGAIGMALIARQWKHGDRRPPASSAATTCRVSRMTSRDFVCKACSNYCDIKEFTIEGQKSYWGDKCSDKFRKPSRHRPQAGDRGPVRVPREGDRGAHGGGRPERAPAPGCAWASRGRCPSSTATRSGTATSPSWASRSCSRRRPTTRSPPTAWNWRWRSPATRFRWRTGTRWRCSTRAWTTCCCRTS